MVDFRSIAKYMMEGNRCFDFCHGRHGRLHGRPLIINRSTCFVFSQPVDLCASLRFLESLK